MNPVFYMLLHAAMDFAFQNSEEDASLTEGYITSFMVVAIILMSLSENTFS